VLAVSAVGDPRAFEWQLAALGAEVVPRSYPDHHAFTDDDAVSIADAARRAAIVVCTLKDFVKLVSRWPRQGPSLWYVSQRPGVEEGRDAIDAMIAAVLRARSPHP
jgi:tetraacyldisaccharide 4'-kinase